MGLDMFLKYSARVRVPPKSSLIRTIQKTSKNRSKIRQQQARITVQAPEPNASSRRAAQVLPATARRPSPRMSQSELAVAQPLRPALPAQKGCQVEGSEKNPKHANPSRKQRSLPKRQDAPAKHVNSHKNKDCAPHPQLDAALEGIDSAETNIRFCDFVCSKAVLETVRFQRALPVATPCDQSCFPFLPRDPDVPLKGRLLINKTPDIESLCSINARLNSRENQS